MGSRKTIIANNEIYHIYNRGVEKRPIFLTKRDYQRFFDTVNYYRFANTPIKFSYFKLLSGGERQSLFKRLEKEANYLIEIEAFCFMPNHIHFLLKQLKQGGISKFMAKITTAFSHYFNAKNKRAGHLFQGNFGAVRIETEEQLLHVSRYIHLNPVTSYLIEFEDLENYQYSSYPEYIGTRKGFCNTQDVMGHFKGPESYKKFVEDQVDYARELENIKHLALED